MRNISDTNEFGSKTVAAAAIEIALTADREKEAQKKAAYAEKSILCAAADYGGDFLTSVNKIVERAVVSSKREGLIGETHIEEGAVAGATREAIAQIMNKAIGLNVGGKIGIARSNEHIAVCIYFGIGLLHLNEVAIGLGHRVV